MPQALLQSVLAQVLARVDSTVSGMGSPADVLTLAVERSTRSAVLAAYEIVEQRQRHSTSRQQQQQQQRPQTPADPTADAEGVTDSEACFFPALQFPVGLQACTCFVPARCLQGEGIRSQVFCPTQSTSIQSQIPPRVSIPLHFRHHSIHRRGPDARPLLSPADARTVFWRQHEGPTPLNRDQWQLTVVFAMRPKPLSL